MNNTNKKICLVASSLGKGGAERATAIQSKMLTDLGYSVHIVIVNSIIEYEYSGELFDLGALKLKGFGRISRLLEFKKYLEESKFYAIIDNRSRVQAYREFILTKFIYPKSTIYVIHSFQKSITFTKYGWLNKWLYKNADMVGVSEEMSQHFKKEFDLRNITTIHNAFDFEKIYNNAVEGNIKKDIPDSYILFYGRIDNSSKNLNLLLSAYKQSELISKNIKLMILGNGPDIKALKNQVKSLDMVSDVIFENQASNPFPYVKNAKFMILTSHYEGFPMVIPESLYLETPVISVNCKSGPKEIIENKYNGLLVENYNSKALSEAMNSFIFDEILYRDCKSNAKQSVKKFDVNEISKKWQALLNKLEWKEN